MMMTTPKIVQTTRDISTRNDKSIMKSKRMRVPLLQMMKKDSLLLKKWAKGTQMRIKIYPRDVSKVLVD